MTDDPPPFLGTWKRVYACILVYLAAVLVLFWWFTRTWNR